MKDIIYPTNPDDFPLIDIDTFSDLKGKQPPPILVVGMHNSGTTILTELLEAGGVFFGSNMDRHENFFFSSFVNDRILLGGQGNWARLPLISYQELDEKFTKISSFIHDHWLFDYMQWGYDGKSPWGIKDPRLSVLLSLYLKIFPESKVVHIQRNPNDIAASLTMKYKEGVGVLKNFDHWKNLTNQYNDRVNSLAGKSNNYYDIKYEVLCNYPEKEIEKLFDFLALDFNSLSPNLINTVTTERIGSYQRWQKSQKHPIWSKIKSRIREVLPKRK